MTRPPRELRNVPDSVHARLLAIAKRDGRDFTQVLNQYFQERLLDRLARSSASQQFVLKGALLFVAHDHGSTETRGRPTKDIDLEALTLKPETSDVRARFAAIAALPSEPDDGVVFAVAEIEAEQMAEDKYEGVRVHIPALLGKMLGRVQIDVGFGDAITPQPRPLSFPTLLSDYLRPQLLTYPLETVVAEKFEAAIDLAEANTRMKDFRDLYVLAVTTPFEGAIVAEAVTRTFERRGTSMSAGSTVMTEGFAKNPERHAGDPRPGWPSVSSGATEERVQQALGSDKAPLVRVAVYGVFDGDGDGEGDADGDVDGAADPDGEPRGEAAGDGLGSGGHPVPPTASSTFMRTPRTATVLDSWPSAHTRIV